VVVGTIVKPGILMVFVTFSMGVYDPNTGVNLRVLPETEAEIHASCSLKINEPEIGAVGENDISRVLLKRIGPALDMNDTATD